MDDAKSTAPVNKETATTADQEAATMEVPTFYINKMFVNFSTDGVRVTFAEESMPSKYMKARTAIFLSMNGFRQLHELAGTVLNKFAEIEKANGNATAMVPAPAPATSSDANPAQAAN